MLTTVGQRKRPRSRPLALLCAFFAILAAPSQLAMAQAPALRIVSAEEPPTNFTEGGRFTGFVTETVRAIAALLGEDATIEVYPWVRAYALASEQANVMIFTAGRTAERIEHGFSFVGPVTTRRHTLYARADGAISIASLEDVRRLGLRVGAMRGDWRGERRAFDELQRTGFLSELSREWSGRLGMELRYSPAKGFFVAR